MRTRSQEFADAVFPHVQAAAAGSRAAKYRSLCRSAGSLVRNSGLLPALSFFAARGSKESERHHRDLLGWLQSEIITLRLADGLSGMAAPDLLQWLRTCPLPEYLRLTRDVLRLLTWHKRLSETLIVKSETPEPVKP